MQPPDYIVTRESAYQIGLTQPATAATMAEMGFTGRVFIRSKRAAVLAYECAGDPYDLSFVYGSRKLFDRFVRLTPRA